MLTTAPWAPDYVAVYARRQRAVQALQQPAMLQGSREWYRTRPVQFICDWVDTYDPRNAGVPDKLAFMPLQLFKRQEEFVDFLHQLLLAEANGLVEKSRDMGATWVSVGFTVWLWLYWPGVSIGWGSRKQELVDRYGDMDSIFEKLRSVLRRLPPEILPVGFSEAKHCNHMRIYNPENDASITGEVGDNIGRGGRKRIYFKDESAHYEHPEMIEASLMDNTRVQVDISSVNGLGNVFHRRRESGIDWQPGMTMERGRTYVFVMDWRDHPHKTQEWYNERKRKSVDEGLLHKFYQEVDRNYASSIEGIIILPEWVQAAIDAHKVLGIAEGGMWGAALDVADGGMDTNALGTRHGVFVKDLQSWGERDTGTTTRRAIAGVRALVPIALQYDCIGIGAGVKAEYNRINEERTPQGERLIPKDLTLVPWSAADEVRFKEQRLIPGDSQSPINGDLFGNLKAQAWWQLARRFERTYRAVLKKQGVAEQQDFTYNVDDLIVLPGELPLLRKLQKELSQPVFKQSASLRLIVDKTPDGTRSPNLADVVMMVFWPMPGILNVSAQVLSTLAQMPPRRPPRRY